MSEVKIPEGYKQTEVGVIPKDWEVEPLKSLLKEPPKYGINAAAVPLTGNLPVYIRITDISEDGYYSPEKVVGVNSPFSSSYILNEGDIVLARTGASVGKSYLYRKEDGTLIYAGFLIKVSPDKRLLNSKYLHQYLKTEQYWAWVIVNSMRSGQPGINGNEYGRLLIPLPSIEEQTAIATALSDVDNLIQSLDKLIAKKEDIKTGTMQQLLTGKTRLPEFATRDDGSPKGFKQTELGRIPEDWDYADIFTFLSTSSNSRADLSNSGDYGYIHYGDIHTKWHTRLDLSKTSLPKISKNLVTSAFVQHGDIVIADASEDYEGVGKSIEISNQSSKPVVSGLHTFLLRDKNEQLSDGFRGLINDIPVVKASIQRLATGLKVYGISKKNLITVMIPVPDKKEQTDMDTEIQALQQRLEKTKDIKQGMMQQLLTGKVRLAH